MKGRQRTSHKDAGNSRDTEKTPQRMQSQTMMSCYILHSICLTWNMSVLIETLNTEDSDKRWVFVISLRSSRGCCSHQTGRSSSITLWTLLTWCLWFPSTSLWSLTWLWDPSPSWETWDDSYRSVLWMWTACCSGKNVTKDSSHLSQSLSKSCECLYLWWQCLICSINLISPIKEHTVNITCTICGGSASLKL